MSKILTAVVLQKPPHLTSNDDALRAWTTLHCAQPFGSEVLQRKGELYVRGRAHFPLAMLVLWQASLADVPTSMLEDKRVLVRVDFNVPQVRLTATAPPGEK